MRWGLTALALLGACGDPAPRPRPVEIPISEYRVEGKSPGKTPAESPAAKATPAATTDGPSSSSSSTAIAEEPRYAGTTTETPSRELDLKGGFLGATLGAPPKAFRGLTVLDRKPDAVTYRASDKSYGGFALRDVLFIFRKGKLATIQFTVKNAADCKAFRETLVKELGAPQRSAAESATWRGEKVGLRFVVGSTGTCAGAVQSKELSRPEWDSL